MRIIGVVRARPNFMRRHYIMYESQNSPKPVTQNLLYYLAPLILQSVIGVLVMVPVTTYYQDPKDIGIVAILSVNAIPIGALSSTGNAWILSGN